MIDDFLWRNTERNLIGGQTKNFNEIKIDLKKIVKKSYSFFAEFIKLLFDFKYQNFEKSETSRLFVKEWQML